MPEFSVKGSGAIPLQKTTKTTISVPAEPRLSLRWEEATALSLSLSRPQKETKLSSALAMFISLMPLRSKESTFHTLAELDLAAHALERLLKELLITLIKVSWTMIK